MNSDLDKKLKEVWSRFGGEPVYSSNKYIESFCLFISRWKYKLTSGIYFSTKYFLQRIFRGFDDLDKWNAAWYIARKAIPVLTAWRNSKIMGTSIKRHIESRFGEIIELSEDEIHRDDIPPAFSEEEWKGIIDDIIFAFSFILNEDNINTPFNEELYKMNYNRYKRGMKLFSIYFMCLWD